MWSYPRKTLNSKIPKRISSYISPLYFVAYFRKLNAYFRSLAFKLEVTVCYFLYKYHLFYFLCCLHKVLKVKSFPDGFWLLNKKKMKQIFLLNISTKEAAWFYSINEWTKKKALFAFPVLILMIAWFHCSVISKQTSIPKLKRFLLVYF